MRMFSIIGFVLVMVAGCHALSPRHTVIEEDAIKLDSTRPLTKPEPIDRPRTLTFIEALRESCTKFGTFTLMYQGAEEIYECRQVN